MSGTVTAAFPSGPLLDPVTGEVTPAWRGFFVALYARTGAATGTPTGATQTALDAETAARIAGDHNLQAQIDSITSGIAASDTVIMQRGNSASDSAAKVRVTLPTPYTTRTLTFVCDGNPTDPLAYFAQGPSDVMTTSLVTGTLQFLDPSSSTVIPLPGRAFTWYATGV